jgi:hypothetical protein
LVRTGTCNIEALIRRLLSVTHSNLSSGKVPLGQTPSCRPWQQTACQEEVGSITGHQNEEELSMDQKNWGSEHPEKMKSYDCLSGQMDVFPISYQFSVHM